MNTKKLLGIATLFAVLVTAAIAQPRGGFGGRGGPGGFNPSMLLRRDDVQAELKLTDDQKGKLDEIQSKVREDMQAAMQELGQDATQEARQKVFAKIGAKVTEQINAVLNADQQKRLKELAVQRAGNGAVMDPGIQKEVGLTSDQIDKVKDLQKKQGDAMRSVFEKMRNGEITREDMRPIMEKNQKVMQDEIGKILTDAQKAKLKEMGGAPFTFKEDTGGGGN